VKYRVASKPRLV